MGGHASRADVNDVEQESSTRMYRIRPMDERESRSYEGNVEGNAMGSIDRMEQTQWFLPRNVPNDSSDWQGWLSEADW